MQGQFQQCIILSASVEGETKANNEWRNRLLQDDLEAQGLDHIEVIGSYKGVVEAAFLVLTPDKVNREDVQELAKIYHQESVLHQNSVGECFLRFSYKDTAEHLGKLEQVSQAEARAGEAFTYLPQSDTYWVAKASA